jgi:hypothetical protein
MLGLSPTRVHEVTGSCAAGLESRTVFDCVLIITLESMCHRLGPVLQWWQHDRGGSNGRWWMKPQYPNSALDGKLASYSFSLNSSKQTTFAPLKSWTCDLSCARTGSVHTYEQKWVDTEKVVLSPIWGSHSSEDAGSWLSGLWHSVIL